MKRTSRIALIILVAITCLHTTYPVNAKDKPPNINLVFIDDMGGDFSCFGNTAVKTPNIDRLAEEGLRFEQFPLKEITLNMFCHVSKSSICLV